MLSLEQLRSKTCSEQSSELNSEKYETSSSFFSPFESVAAILASYLLTRSMVVEAATGIKKKIATICNGIAKIVTPFIIF